MQVAYFIDTEEGGRFFEPRELCRWVEDLYVLVLKIKDRIFLVHSTAKQYVFELNLLSW